MKTPSSGWYCYKAGVWQPGLTVTYQGPLKNVSTVEALNASGIPAGTYTFYFVVDTTMDGAVTTSTLFYDEVSVTIAGSSLSPPTEFTGSVSGSTVTISWNAVSGAAGYKFYYGTSSGSYTGSVDLGNITSRVFPNVSDGIYYFAVTAYNSSGESGYSNEVSITVGEDGGGDEGDGGEDGGGGTDTIPPTTIASPAGGTYSTAQSVTLTCEDNLEGSGCSRTYYTTDGSTPTTSSTVYSSAISITSTTTLQFFSVDNAGNQESINTESYTIGTSNPPVIDAISSQSVTVGDGGFTLTITGQNFDETAVVLWDFSDPPYTVFSAPTFVNSSTLTIQVTQNSGGFSTPFPYPGSYYIQVLKPGPNFWDGQRSNTVTFTVFNPVPSISSITGTCKAGLNCVPSNGFDVRINGSGFVNNIAYINGIYVSSTYAEVNGNDTPLSLLGQGPVYSQMQLWINGSLIPTAGTYAVDVCNAGTTQGTPVVQET